VHFACILRAKCAHFGCSRRARVIRADELLGPHVDPVAGPAWGCRIPTRVSSAAPASLEIAPVIDLEEGPAVNLLADEEACPYEFADGRGDLALGDL
jgi:hypothetical protein